MWCNQPHTSTSSTNVPAPHVVEPPARMSPRLQSAIPHIGSAPTPHVVEPPAHMLPPAQTAKTFLSSAIPHVVEPPAHMQASTKAHHTEVCPAHVPFPTHLGRSFVGAPNPHVVEPPHHMSPPTRGTAPSSTPTPHVVEPPAYMSLHHGDHRPPSDTTATMIPFITPSAHVTSSLPPVPIRTAPASAVNLPTDPQHSTQSSRRDAEEYGSAWTASIDALEPSAPHAVLPPENDSVDATRQPHVVSPSGSAAPPCDPMWWMGPAASTSRVAVESAPSDPLWWLGPPAQSSCNTAETPKQQIPQVVLSPEIAVPQSTGSQEVAPEPMEWSAEKPSVSQAPQVLPPPEAAVPPSTASLDVAHEPMERSPEKHSISHVLPPPPPPARSAKQEARSPQQEDQAPKNNSEHSAPQPPSVHVLPPPPAPVRSVAEDATEPSTQAAQSGHIVPPPPPPVRSARGEDRSPRRSGPKHVPPPNWTSGQLTVLMVAEKPSIADTIAAALSGSTATRRTGVAPKAPVYEFSEYFKGEHAHFRVTSTHGHVYGLDFDKEYRDRERTNPGDLFTAAVVRSHDWRSKIPEHLAAEAKGCQVLVLWLDCDREGENICFEVMDNAFPELDTSRSWPNAYRERVFRAKFSSLSTVDLQRAMSNLSIPNENEAHSVDARQEIDLRLGVAFSRFLTQYFHQHFGENMKNIIHDVTYGPCQMPTLWFCVHRHCQIEAFVPKPFWKIGVQIRSDQLEFTSELPRGQIWNEDEARELHTRLQQMSEVRVSSIARRRVTLQRPLPLNTVTMLQQASERAGLSPGDAMHYAEQLYLRGILSYPRTETSRYPAAFDLNNVIYALQVPNAPWASIATRLADLRTRPREDGEDHGDHPPITPVRWASERQCGDASAWALYQLVCRHFLATITPDCVLNETTVHLDMGGTELIAVSSRRATDADGLDWCEATGAQVDEKGSVDLAGLKQESACCILEINMTKEATKPPSHLSESDLLGLMEKHGIGTDASMAQHIGNVLKRGYAKVSGKSRQLVPTGMGLALSHAYTLVDPGLVRPTVRASIENACKRVAKGKARKEDVISNAISIFKRKFQHFSNRVDRVPAMLSVAYKRETAQSAAQWESAAKATAAISLDDLLKSRDSVEIGEEDMSPTGKETLRPGALIQIFGLKGAAELNGQKGTCEQLDASTGRWHVRLANGIVKALRPENLQVQAKPELRAGAHVCLHSLKGASQLNGQLGTCESWDATAGRWHVRLHSGEARALKPENLSVVTEGEAGAKRARPEEPDVENEPTAKRVQTELSERAALKKRVFKQCDKDGDGFLNKEEMYSLAVLSGFQGTVEKWRRVEYLKFCIGCMANMAKGIPEASVLKLLDDVSEDGCYCEDEKLRDFLKSH